MDNLPPAPEQNLSLQPKSSSELVLVLLTLQKTKNLFFKHPLLNPLSGLSSVPLGV